MPKINVYLPDELAEAVRATGVPVSAVCQRALEEAVRRMTALREVGPNALDLDDPHSQLGKLTTARVREVIKLAAARAREAGQPEVGTGHLLAGLLDEGTNLALRVLSALEVEPAAVRSALAARAATATPAPAGTGESAGLFGAHAVAAMELSLSEAISLGHNYVGCEHLLLGLVAEPDGTAGQVLRELGVEPRLARRAVAAALAGYVHLRANTQSSTAATPATAAPTALAEAIQRELRPLVERLERLEARITE
ncbi:MAG: Clp protease N-terminal domain-containing protein [Mycobacteriales bacterium]